MAAPRLLAAQVSTVRLTEHWHVCKDGDPAGLLLYERHYSAHRYADQRIRKLFCGPGEKIVLVTETTDALFVWRKFKDDCPSSPQNAVNCSVFRNEGAIQSSELIRQAERVAECRWPGLARYTYVDPAKVASGLPGYCFKRAGWRRIGATQGGLLIFAHGQLLEAA